MACTSSSEQRWERGGKRNKRNATGKEKLSGCVSLHILTLLLLLFSLTGINSFFGFISFPFSMRGSRSRSRSRSRGRSSSRSSSRSSKSSRSYSRSRSRSRSRSYSRSRSRYTHFKPDPQAFTDCLHGGALKNYTYKPLKGCLEMLPEFTCFKHYLSHRGSFVG